jgi:pantothenate synthetase
MKEQLNGKEKKQLEDLRVYPKEKQQLKKKLEALKVSVAFMHVTVQYHHIC